MEKIQNFRADLFLYNWNRNFIRGVNTSARGRALSVQIWGLRLSGWTGKSWQFVKKASKPLLSHHQSSCSLEPTPLHILACRGMRPTSAIPLRCLPENWDPCHQDVRSPDSNKKHKSRSKIEEGKQSKNTKHTENTTCWRVGKPKSQYPT